MPPAWILPTTATGVFTIAVFADDPRNDATLHVDQYTGTVLADVRWQHYSNVARATEMGVMLHEGKLFGPLNQIVMLLVCLMILLSSVSGLVIWWKRRPQGGLGVPPLRHDLPTWKAGVAIMLALAIAFPLVGSLATLGAPPAALATFVTTLTMVGLVTAPMEISHFGRRFTLLRQGLSFAAAILIGLAMGVFL